MDFNDSIDSGVATDSNSDYNVASDIDPISSSEKSGITTSVQSITSTIRKPFKCFIQNSRHLLLKEIPIPTWPTHYSNAYNLFQLSSFNENGIKFQNTSFIFHGNRIFSQDPSESLPNYSMY